MMRYLSVYCTQEQLEKKEGGMDEDIAVKEIKLLMTLLLGSGVLDAANEYKK